GPAHADDVERRDLAQRAPRAGGASGRDPGDVAAVQEADALALGLGAVEAAHGVRVHETVARREGRPEDRVHRAVEEREPLAHGPRIQPLDAETVRVLEPALLARPREERRVRVEPEIPALAKAELEPVRAEEVERGEAGLDVDRLPPGGAGAA